MDATKRKPILAVDVDEVLFPLLGSFFPYMNATYGHNLKIEHMLTYRTEDLTGETAEELLAKMDTYLETNHYSDARPINGSVAAIHKLHESYDLVIITARHKTFRGLTEKFMDAHFPGLFDAVVYTHQEDAPEIITPKVELCKRMEASLLIDDSLAHVTECAAQGMRAILFGEYAWNKADTLPKGVTRCRDWQEVLEYLDRGL